MNNATSHTDAIARFTPSTRDFSLQNRRTPDPSRPSSVCRTPQQERGIRTISSNARLIPRGTIDVCKAYPDHRVGCCLPPSPRRRHRSRSRCTWSRTSYPCGMRCGDQSNALRSVPTEVCAVETSCVLQAHGVQASRSSRSRFTSLITTSRFVLTKHDTAPTPDANRFWCWQSCRRRRNVSPGNQRILYWR